MITRSVAGLIAVVPLSISLGVAGGVAHADPTPPALLPTTTTVLPPPAAIVKQHHRATVCATVTPRSGSATPVGDVTITITRNVGSYSVSATYPYAGGPVCSKTEKLHGKGGYVAAAYYTARAGTVFVSSVGVDGFDVVKPRH